MLSELERTMLDGITALRAAGLRYAVLGGPAVRELKTARAERRVDLVAELPPDKRLGLRSELESRGLETLAMERELNRYGSFSCRSISYDVHLRIHEAVGPLGEAVLGHRRRLPLVSSLAIWSASDEDLAVFKASSESASDYEDLRSLLAAPQAAALDVPYMEELALSLDRVAPAAAAGERLRRALAEVSAYPPV